MFEGEERVWLKGWTPRRWRKRRRRRRWRRTSGKKNRGVTVQAGGRRDVKEGREEGEDSFVCGGEE